MATKAKVQPTNPYLTVKGAADAIDFYKKAFGAKEIGRMPAEDGKRLMHASIEINGGTVMLSDEFPEFAGDAGAKAPSAAKPAPVATAVHFAKPAEVDAIYRRAVDAGCKSTMAPEDTFWEARFAMLNDPFGHRWMLNAPLPKKKPAGKAKK
jgi:PhnB protein